MSAGSSEPPGLDELRRRLYGPGASAADVARYEAAGGAAEEAPGPSEDAGPPPRRRRSPLVIGTVVVVGAAVIAVAVAAGVRPAAPTSTPTATAATAPTTVDAQVIAPAAARTAFVDALAAGGKAGLLDYFFQHHDRLPPAILTVGRADSTEYAGHGPTTIALAPSALADRGGRATVIVVLATAGAATWRATRPGRRTTVVASRSERLEAGAPIGTTFDYAAPAPTRLRLQVPEGVRWGVVVVFTD